MRDGPEGDSLGTASPNPFRLAAQRNTVRAAGARPAPGAALSGTKVSLLLLAQLRVLAVAVPLPRRLGVLEFLALGPLDRVARLAGLLVDLARFREALGRLVVMARRRLVALAFVRLL